MSKTKMSQHSSYVYELEGADWAGSHNDDWETVVYLADDQEVHVGSKLIDDSLCYVFRCSDGKMRAMLKFHCRLLPVDDD